MAERGLERDDFGRGQRWFLVAGVVVGFLLLYCASIGKWPVATSPAALRLGLVFVLGLNASAAGFAVELAHDLSRPPDTPPRPTWVRLLLWAIVLAVGVLDGKIRLLDDDQQWAFAAAAAVGVVLGLVLSIPAQRRFRRNRAEGQPMSTREQGGLWLLSGLGGVVLGMVFGGAIVAVSFVTQHHDAAAFRPAIPTVAGIEGEYVAIGDSYSAGEGLRPFNHNTRGRDDDGPESNRCHRSQRAYSQILEFAGAEPSERFAACSGAVIHDIYHPLLDDPEEVNDATEVMVPVEGEDIDRVKVPSQVDAGIVHPEVGLVTLTVGGNDMLFARIVRFCLEEPSCLDQEFDSDVTGDRFVDYPSPRPLEEWLRATMEKVGEAYDVLYPDLRASFPNARIIVLGYPHLFPEGHAGVLPSACTVVLRRASAEERAGIRRLADDFNALIEERATAAGLEFVSVTEAWQGHEPCGDLGQFTNGVEVLGSDGSFHPNQAGQLALAHVVAAYLRDHPDGP